MIGDLRVRNAWRTAHAAAEAAPDDSDADVDVDVDDSPSLEWVVAGLGTAHLPAGAGIRVPPPVTVPLASPAPPPAKLAPRGEFNPHEWMDSLKDVEVCVRVRPCALLSFVRSRAHTAHTHTQIHPPLNLRPHL